MKFREWSEEEELRKKGNVDKRHKRFDKNE